MTAPPRPTAIETFQSADVRWAPALLIDIKAVAMAAYRGAATISAIAIPPAAAHPDVLSPTFAGVAERPRDRPRVRLRLVEARHRGGDGAAQEGWAQEAGQSVAAAGISSGVDRRRILTAYVMRNALAPQVTGLAMSLGAIFNGAIITEEVLGYPGIGTLLIGGVRAGDYSLVLGVTTVSILAVSIAVAATTRRAFVDGQAFTQP